MWTLNFGPQHPATHTTLRLILTLDGEKVVDAVPHIGYLHSGFEKLGEHLDFNQYVTIVDRMNYISPVANEIAWHHAVEKLIGIELTPRCKYLRTILAELMRLHDHLLNVGTAALDLGCVHRVFVRLSAARKYLRHRRVRLGPAVSCELHARRRRVVRCEQRRGSTGCGSSSRRCRRRSKRSTGCSRKNRIFIDRTKGIGVLTKADAINFGATGPIARASGVVRDLRKDEPYLAYPDFDFKVVCSEAGDCYARYLCRMREMAESLKIIEQAIENIPGGPVNIDVTSDAVLPAKPAVYRSIEGLIQHFEVLMPNRGYDVPTEELYAATESPNGELGFYIVADGNVRAYRARTRPPSYIHFAMLPHMIRGYQLSDVVAVLGSINIIAAELDR